MASSGTNQQIGNRGEDVAADFLRDKGYRILERNYRFERSEVDLVCFEPSEQYEEGGELVFVEVKTRSSLDFGAPEEAVTDEKKKHIMHATEAFLYERHLEGAPARFDVVAVVLKQGEAPDIRHYENAFASL
jgi:putative endonuclease